MKPEELVNISNAELAKKEQEDIDKVLNTIYGTFKEFIKAGDDNSMPGQKTLYLPKDAVKIDLN